MTCNSAVFAKRSIIGHILHRKEKGQFYEVFQYWPGHRRRKRSPYRAYFPEGLPLFLRVIDGKNKDYIPIPVISPTIC
jgi:hypothetical protein